MLESVASEIETLCPEETRDQHDAFFLPADLSKITGTFHGTSREHIDGEIKLATERRVTDEASIAYHLKNVVINNGCLYKGTYKLFISKNGVTPRGEAHFENAALVSTMYGSRYFGHWLSDDCLQYQLAADLSLNPFCVPGSNYPHQSYYKRYFQQDWTPGCASRIDNLVVFKDFSQGTSKRRRYEVLRARLAEQLKQTNTNNGGLVYLRRGNTGASRRLANQHALEAALSKLGFVIEDTANPNPEAMLRSMMGASLVVSMEGSHAMPFLFTTARNGGLLILQPPDRFNCVLRSIADCLGIRFGFIVGNKVNDGYQFSPDDLLTVVEKMSR